jgi:hypothetical protein
MVPMPTLTTSDSERSAELSPERLAAHAYALDASGWTVARSQLDPPSLAELRAAADRALEATRRAIAEGRAGGHTVVDDHYLIARRFYRWSDAAMALLEHPAVTALGARMLGGYRLFDMSVNATQPLPAGDRSRGTGWHRDFGTDLHHGTAVPSHLYLFFCLRRPRRRQRRHLGGAWQPPPHGPA